MKINKLIIDSSASITDLCKLGIEHPTDKSPYNKDPNLHKHAYTAIYDFLFSSIRYKEIKFAEIGIYNNESMKCWREYFPNALLYGFEWDDNYLKNAQNEHLKNTQYIKMNVKDETHIKIGFEAFSYYDVLIDDSTHEFEDQIRIINAVYKYMKIGGMIIIEDIFLSEDENKYAEALDHLKEYFSSITFIEANHILKHSPGWNNDKLLVLFRNDKT